MDIKRMSYLQERLYKDNREQNQERLLYWTDILGEELISNLKCDREFADYIHCEKYEVKKDFYSKLPQRQHLKLNEDDSSKLRQRLYCSPHICFAEFFITFVEEAVAEVERNIKHINCYCRSVLFEFSEWVCAGLQTICMRTLIADMHKQKADRKLHGKDEREEYTYYCKEFLGDENYRMELLESFPVLYRCIIEVIRQKVTFFSEIMKYFDEDIPLLCDEGIIPAGEGAAVVHIEVDFSDTHRQGRQVVRMTLENGRSILYKPHSMENEQIYSQLLWWLEKETGITQKYYPILSRKTHSWCAIVAVEDCKEEAELRAYYRRLGVQLFLAYILGTKDLHSENVIAAGGYPVLVDLETLVNLPARRKGDSAEAELYYQFSHSVLYTGLLPFYSWSKEGRGVNASAISGIEGQIYPFKIPVVVNPRTSSMQIAYRYPHTEKGNNLALLNGIFREPYLYEQELIEGFETSYRAVLAKKEEFLRELDKLSDVESRYLVADTQRYHMQLAASYHPALLCDGAEREIFLKSMWMGRDWNNKKIEQLVNSEIKDLLQGDIPYFSYQLNQTKLIDSVGKEIINYFEHPAMEILKEKVINLNQADMKNQGELIHVSMQLMPQKDRGFVNGIYGREAIENSEDISREQAVNALRKVTDKILDAAIYNRDKTDVSWYGIQLSPYGDSGWEIRPMNPYFYSGIAGMATLFHKLQCLDKREEVQQLTSILDRKLFAYTKEAGLDKKNIKSGYTGMYEGEASIIYAYLNIYQMEHDEIYLCYAERHSEVLEEMLEQDRSYDLLSGNAGAAYIFIRLYEITKEQRYLEAAKKAVAYLEEAASVQEVGIGWVTEKGIPPMAGMAHGCSGIVLPFAQLYKYTGEEHYFRMAGKILDYENSLYDNVIQNWRDVRGKEGAVEDKNGAIAWCHGAAGILLSRTICLEYVKGTDLEDIVKRDRRRAFEKVWKYPVRDGLCLCHGTCGNLMILKECGKKQEAGKIEQYVIRRVLVEETKMLPQERVSFGMMNGWGGIAGFLTEIE